MNKISGAILVFSCVVVFGLWAVLAYDAAHPDPCVDSIRLLLPGETYPLGKLCRDRRQQATQREGTIVTCACVKSGGAP